MHKKLYIKENSFLFLKLLFLILISNSTKHAYKVLFIKLQIKIIISKIKFLYSQNT